MLDPTESPSCTTVTKTTDKLTNQRQHSKQNVTQWQARRKSGLVLMYPLIDGDFAFPLFGEIKHFVLFETIILTIISLGS